MIVETIEHVRYEPGDLVDLSEAKGPSNRAYKALNRCKKGIILRENGSSYDVLTDDYHLSHIPPNQLGKIKYIKHIDLDVLMEDAGESQTG